MVGDRILKSIDLLKDSLVIGRTPNCELRIDNPSVSRSHARIFKEGGAYYIEDLGSSNGTFVHGSRVDRLKINVGDEIKIGKFVLVIGEKDPFGGEEGPHAVRSTSVGYDPGKTMFFDKGPKPPAPAKSSRPPPVVASPTPLPSPPPAAPPSRPEIGEDALVKQLSHSKPVSSGELFADPPPVSETPAAAVEPPSENPSLLRGSDSKVVPLPVLPFLIGSGQDVHLHVKGVRKNHCSLYKDQRGVFVLTAKGWLNRIRVNGKKIKKASLKNGDEIALGKETFTFRK